MNRMDNIEMFNKNDDYFWRIGFLRGKLLSICEDVQMLKSCLDIMSEQPPQGRKGDWDEIKES